MTRGMSSIAVAVIATLAASLLGSCGQPDTTSTTPAKAALPVKPSMSVEAKVLNANRVEFTITTNLPTPIDVAASVELDGQKPDDPYIGYDEHVMLTGPVTKVVLDISKTNKPLPASAYEATVSFYPRWGAEKNPAAAGAPELHAMAKIQLTGSGGNAADAALKYKRQRWVMENVISNSPWDRATMAKQLGKPVKGPADLSPLHDAYYFPGADMTLIVNRLKNEVTIWRMGHETK